MILNTLILFLLFALPILIGIFMGLKIKSKKITNFLTGLSFMMLISLLVSKFIPSIIDNLNNYYDLGLIISGEVLGLLILLLMECFIPHHLYLKNEKTTAKNSYKMHLYHIGVMSMMTLSFIDFYYGVSFASKISNGFKDIFFDLILLTIINIVLLVQIVNYLKNNKKLGLYKYATLSIGGIIGITIGLVFKTITSTFNILMLAIICGMILYTAIFELGVEASTYTKERGILEGVLIGAIFTALLLI